MNRHALSAGLLLGALALSAAPAPAAGPPAASVPTIPAALRSAEHFALGGVGFAGTVSEGEKALRSVLARPDAVAVLETLLGDPKATPAARLYALLGLRWKDAPSYKKAAADLRARKQVVVATMRGCIAGEEKLADVAARIDSGKYDAWREPFKPVSR